jgi:hypothetical protein
MPTSDIGKLRPLFRVEHEATAIEIVGTREHLELRTQRSKPVVDDFFQWATTLRASVLPKSPLGDALNQRLASRALPDRCSNPIHNTYATRVAFACVDCSIRPRRVGPFDHAGYGGND